MSTVKSVSATRSMRSRSARISALAPMRGAAPVVDRGSAARGRRPAERGERQRQQVGGRVEQLAVPSVEQATGEAHLEEHVVARGAGAVAAAPAVMVRNPSGPRAPGDVWRAPSRHRGPRRGCSSNTRQEPGRRLARGYMAERAPAVIALMPRRRSSALRPLPRTAALSRVRSCRPPQPAGTIPVPTASRSRTPPNRSDSGRDQASRARAPGRIVPGARPCRSG